MNYYLIRFEYQHYCQGYERATETLLVKAISFDAACELIKLINKYHNVQYFENCTL